MLLHLVLRQVCLPQEPVGNEPARAAQQSEQWQPHLIAN